MSSREVEVKMTVFDDGKPPVIILNPDLFEEIEGKMSPIVRFASLLLGVYKIMSLACFMVPMYRGNEAEEIASISMSEYMDFIHKEGEREEQT